MSVPKLKRRARADLAALAAKSGLKADSGSLALSLSLLDAADLLRSELFAPLQAALGISEGRFVLLVVLREQESLSLAELAAHSGVSNASASVMVKRMLQEVPPLIESVAAPGSGRALKLRLTDKGRELCDKLIADHLAKVSRIFSVFSPSELETMLRLMQKLT